MLLIHHRAIDTPIYTHFVAANPEHDIKIIEHNTHAYMPKYGNVSPLFKDHFREKRRNKALLFRSAKWKPEPNGNSTDFLPGLMMTQGCGFGCTYCYTERHYINNYPKLYQDAYGIVDMIGYTMDNEELLRPKMIGLCKKDYEKHRDPLHGDWITFDLGCDSDCVLDNNLTAHDDFPGHIIDIMNQVSNIKQAKTSFATKSASLNPFIDYIKSPTHHRIRLSLMPEHHRINLEINTSKIYDRLEAANRLVDKGFEVHLNLSPIVVTSQFTEEYTDLLVLIDSVLSKQAKQQLAYEIIFLTHTVGQFEMVQSYAPKAHSMMVNGPLDLVPKPTKPNVLSYSQLAKKELKATLGDLISRITPYSRIRYCY
jgi:spore photoproduct lyase